MDSDQHNAKCGRWKAQQRAACPTQLNGSYHNEHLTAVHCCSDCEKWGWKYNPTCGIWATSKFENNTVREALPTQRHDASVNRLEAGFALRQRLMLNALGAPDVFLVRRQFGLPEQ